MHGGDQHQPLTHAGLLDDLFDLGRDVNIVAMPLGVEFQVLGMDGHSADSTTLRQTAIFSRHHICMAILDAKADVSTRFLNGKDRPTLDGLRAAAVGCTACPLYKRASQTVFGEGSSHAEVVLVGEQP